MHAGNFAQMADQEYAYARGAELRAQVHKDPCFAMISSLQEDGGAEEAHLFKKQALLIRQNTNGILPTVYDDFSKIRNLKWKMTMPWHLDRSTLVGVYC